MEKNIELIEELREELPETIVGIGYGSGMYKQKGYGASEKPDKDIIFVVDNLHTFLAEDYQRNPEHFYGDKKKYHSDKTVHPRFFYNRIGCLKFSKGQYRYKLLVVEKDALLYDLMTWKYFTLAARLSKPITYNEMPEDIETLISYNRDQLIITALLSSVKNQMPVNELYRIISNLSYNGDFRMLVRFEKSTKVSDIVEGALEEFEKMYGNNPLLNRNGNTIENIHPTQLISGLPVELREYILNNVPDLTDLNMVSRAISDYFFKTNLKGSLRLMYSCTKTLGIKSAVAHALTKKKKAKR